MLRKCLFLLVVTLSLHFPSYSQDAQGAIIDGGFTVGPMVFLGDLGGHFGKGTTFIKDYNFSTTKLAFGAFVAAYPQPWLGLRLSLNYGNITGDDGNITNKGGDEVTRLNRHLDFRSVILEANLMAEFYPTVFLEDEPEDVTGRLRPYGLAGIGVYHFNPQGSYTDPVTHNSTWVDLQPLHTEGEGFGAGYPPNYKLTQFNIPLGAGIKYFFSEDLNVSFEIVHRKLFTDYVDDVSMRYIDPSLFAAHLSPSQAAIATTMANKSPLQFVPNSGYQPGNKRGDPSQNDAYFTMQFKVGFRINGSSETRWRNSTHCPLLRF
jgi:hypothetical protein